MLRPLLAILATCLLANAVLLDEFWTLVREDDLALAGSDMSTHYLRVLHAKELYLPSGHHFGWDPYWFQGFVPFLLYPHLTYVVLALAGMVLPIGLERLFNLYVLAIYFALPVAAGLSVVRPLGLVPALVLTSWFSVLSTTGAGLTGVFVVGLLSQQVGTILFTLLAVDLVVTRRLDRAAIWLGLIPLVQVHASLIAAMAWMCAGAAVLADRTDRRAKLQSWLSSSLLAVAIGSPTLVGLLHGWGNIGSSTTFVETDGLLWRLAGGSLLAPLPAMLAIVACFLASLYVVPKRDRARLWLCWTPLALLLLAVSAHKWSTGLPLADRMLSTMLFLRTFSFAFAWIAVVALCYWRRFPASVRMAAVALSLAGVLLPRQHEASVERSIGSVWRTAGGKPAKSVPEYRSALRWIAGDVGAGTATLALAVPRPRGAWLAEAIERCGQPLLGGHGIELTSINNSDVVARTLGMRCDSLRLQVRDYAIGYIVGTSVEQREKLEECFRQPASYSRGAWWVFATGMRWGLAGPATGFRHDPTWTKLEWTLRPLERNTAMQLPMASNPQWIADVDGQPVAIESTKDDMMSLVLPAGGERLRLRYQGYPGEWSSVAVSFFALVGAAVRVRRGSLLQL